MRGPHPRFLASVRDAGEARLAAALGAEVIDCKEPDAGALGAVALPEQRRILAALGPVRPPVSATVGDLPFEARILAGAIERTAAAGVDIVKFGVFASGARAQSGFAELDELLHARAPGPALVALLLADQLSDIDEACTLARCAMAVRGMRGVMLDTQAKGAGARSLPEIFSVEDLACFTTVVHANGGWAGLAGALCAGDARLLSDTGADLLGFRGALCASSRSGAIDPDAFADVRGQMLAARAARSAAGSPSNTMRVQICGMPAASSG